MDKKINKIVLTGGPCAGKTTALNWIKTSFEKEGYKVIFIGEAATELINSGLNPKELSRVEFESLLMKLQIKKEDLFEKACENIDNDKILLVCDRGILDNRAYMSEEEFNFCLKNNGLTLEGAKERYDACFHLVTAAKGVKDSYNLDNKARMETLTEASLIDDKTLNAWIGHSHLKVIDNYENFEDKMRKLILEISNVLGIPYPFEIERKFLIEMPDINFLEQLDNCSKVKIVQTYLKSDDEYEKRVRLRSSCDSFSYTMTKKKQIDSLKRIEIEQKLTKEEYIEALLDVDFEKSPIVKDRYCICYKNKYFEVDIYPEIRDYAICEIELLDEDESFNFPDYLTVIEEVTTKEEYKNSNIAKRLVKIY
ncbi:MAG: AAA family ATPase [bacterium]|nr:AAA family ATPase [bacterium]